MPGADQSDDRRHLERLALAEWPGPARARVRSVTVAGDRAEVALAVNGGHDHWMYFQRDGNGWPGTVSGNGPALGWDAPDAIAW